MRNSGSYQLVSEHSILSARRKNGYAAITPRTRSQRLKEFGERVRQIGATRESESYCHHDANTTTPDFKVYDRGRGRTEEENSRRRRSREDEFHEKLEEMAEILRSYLSNVAVKSSTPDKERSPELEAMNLDTEELERKKIEKNKSQGSHDRSMVFVLENRSDEEASWEELMLEDSSVTENSLVVSFLSLGSEACEKEEWKKVWVESRPEEEKQSGGDGKLAATELGGGTVAEVPDDGVDTAGLQRVHDLGVHRVRELEVSLSVEMRNSEAGEKKIWAEDFPRKVDPVILSLGQAQVKVSSYDLFHRERGVLKERTEVENKLEGFGCSQKKVDLTFNSMGQAHNFIITPTIFANSGGELQVENKMDKKELVGFDWDQNPSLSLTFEAGASVFGFVGAPKFDVCVSAVVVSFSKNRKATIIYDPGGHFSSLCITWSSCFMLWDPGGRLLTVCFCYLHLEDKVNV